MPGATQGTRQRSLCRVPGHGAPGKEIKKNKKILCRVPSSSGTRQRPMTKKAGPCKEAFAGCQVMGHPAKKFKKKIFAGCLTAWHPAKADGRWPPSSRPHLPAAIFCRVAGTRQRPIFADGWNLPSAGTGQRLLCRRPLFAGCLQAWHPAKNSFAGCPIKSTRQIFLLPANQPFPVVI